MRSKEIFKVEGLWFVFFGLVGAVFLIYGRTLSGPFLNWDDTQHFQFNYSLRHGQIGRFWKAEYYGLYIPMTYSAWTIIHHLTGGDACAFHIFNLILHALNAHLLFLAARDLLGSSRSPASGAALFAAFFFLLHPAQVEPVAWISGGRDLLAAFFGFLSLIVLLKRGPVPATFLFAFGLLCKPSLAAWPLALIVMDRLRKEQSEEQDHEQRKHALLPWPFAAVWLLLSAAAALITASIQTPFVHNRLEPLSLGQRLTVAIDTLAFYLHHVAIPWPLSADYARTPAEVWRQASGTGTGDDTSIPLEPHFYLNLAMAFAFVTATYLLGRHFHKEKKIRADVGAYLGFSAAMLVPVLGLIPFEAQVQSTVFDRYLYLPIAGVSLAVSSLLRVFFSRRTGILAAAVLLCAFATLSFTQSEIWTSNRRLFSAILEHSPKNYFANTNLALVEINDKNLDAAEAHLKLARRSNPRLALAPANLAYVYWLKRDPASILAEFRSLVDDPAFLRYNQNEPQALALLYRMVARSLGSIRHREEARNAYSNARLLNPEDEDLVHEFKLFLQEK